MARCGVPGCVTRGTHGVDEHTVQRTIFLSYELDAALQARARALGVTFYSLTESLLHSAFYGKTRTGGSTHNG